MKNIKLFSLFLLLTILLCSYESDTSTTENDTNTEIIIDYSVTTSNSQAEDPIITFDSKYTQASITVKTPETTTTVPETIVTTTAPETTQTTTSSTTIISENSNKEKVKFYAKVDGDTAKFKLSSGNVVTCRFLAIDTPETVKPNSPVEYYRPEASSFTENALKNAIEIELEYDPNSDLYDKYGRLLAWVWIDNELLQSELVSQGYAEVKYIYGDYYYVDQLRQLEKVAKQSRLGIWS